MYPKAISKVQHKWNRNIGYENDKRHINFIQRFLKLFSGTLRACTIFLWEQLRNFVFVKRWKQAKSHFVYPSEIFSFGGMCTRWQLWSLSLVRVHMLKTFYGMCFLVATYCNIINLDNALRSVSLTRSWWFSISVAAIVRSSSLSHTNVPSTRRFKWNGDLRRSVAVVDDAEFARWLLWLLSLLNFRNK